MVNGAAASSTVDGEPLLSISVAVNVPGPSNTFGNCMSAISASPFGWRGPVRALPRRVAERTYPGTTPLLPTPPAVGKCLGTGRADVPDPGGGGHYLCVSTPHDDLDAHVR